MTNGDITNYWYYTTTSTNTTSDIEIRADANPARISLDTSELDKIKEEMQKLKDMFFLKVIVPCTACGQAGAALTPCKHCGYPIPYGDKK